MSLPISPAVVMQLFAPANLRATADNPAYGELVRHWMEQRYTLRYSGGMVPDVNHIFAKARAPLDILAILDGAPRRLCEPDAVTSHIIECSAQNGPSLANSDRRYEASFRNANPWPSL